MAVVVVDQLVKRYGALTAVNGISFSVEKGEVFGVLGPNGAGKTTTLEMIEGLRRPDGGSIQVLDHDMLVDATAVKQHIGIQLQATALPPFTGVREAIDLFAALYVHARPTDELLREFDLVDKASARTDRLSGGQQQRLSIALALVNEPELVFLDEPTTGLDPQARLNIWETVERIRAAGTTVILTTHYMEEAERLADRIAVMDHGSIVALDTPARLIAAHAPGTRIEFGHQSGVADDVFRTLQAVDSVALGERIRVSTTQPELVLRQLLDPAAPWAAGGGIRDLMVRQGTLEEVFINVTGSELRE